MNKYKIIKCIKLDKNVDMIFKSLQCCNNCKFAIPDWDGEFNCKLGKLYNCKSGDKYNSQQDDYWELKILR